VDASGSRAKVTVFFATPGALIPFSIGCGGRGGAACIHEGFKDVTVFFALTGPVCLGVRRNSSQPDQAGRSFLLTPPDTQKWSLSYRVVVLLL